MYHCLLDDGAEVTVTGKKASIMRITALSNLFFESTLLIAALFTYFYYIVGQRLNTFLLTMIYFLVTVCLGS